MADRIAPVCPPCVEILTEMCRLGGAEQPQLCEIQAAYVATGDPDLVGQAQALAPRIAWAATRALRQQGRVAWPGAPSVEGGTA